MARHVVIAGGGFGGLYAARSLIGALPSHSARVTLVNDVNYLLYTPLLPGAAAGTLEPRHVVVPLRHELRGADLHLGCVTGADSQQRVLGVDTAAGHHEELHYDQLIVALGSVSRTLDVPGLVEHGRGFKTLADAISLRNHVITTLEAAEIVDDEALRAQWLTYVFVGAGYAGLEGLAELQDFATDALEFYPRCRVSGMRWILVEARERVMPEVSPSLAGFAQRELRGRGIEIRTSTTVREITASSTTLSDDEVVPTRTVVWTAGVRPHPVVASLGLPLDAGGRITTDRYMRVTGHDDTVWAIGDAAAVPDPARPGQPSPPTAQHAIRQGRLVGRNVAAALGVGRMRPFRYKTRGVFVDMGRGEAVAETMGVRWRGAPAWLLARTYHLLLMPGTGRKLRLLVDWNVALLFRRDIAQLDTLGHPEGLDQPSAGGTDSARGGGVA